MKRAFAASATTLLLALSRLARAEGCPVTDRPVVELIVEVEPPDQIIALTLERHLRSELGAREIDLCTSKTSKRPIARIKLHIDHPADGPVVATIQIGDEVTDKRLERTLQLSKLPADSRPMAVAAATDELLRASWAELVVADAPAPAMQPPQAVTRAVASSLRPSNVGLADARHFELGLLAVGSTFFGHRDALGGDLVGALWLYPRFAATARVGGSAGLARTSSHGSAAANTLEAGLGGAFAVVPETKGVGLRVEAGGSFVRVWFESTPNDGATGHGAASTTAIVDAGVRGHVQTGVVRWNLGTAALFVPRPVRATDAGRVVTSIEGVGLQVSAGASLFL